jgi:hypothetical protein
MKKSFKWMFVGIAGIALWSAIGFGQGGQSLPSAFESWTAADKQDLIWKRISALPYSASDLPVSGPGALELAQGLNPAFAARAFLNPGDEMAPGRAKLIHPLGVAAKVRWVPFANSFSGIFGSGAEGIVRLSIASADVSKFGPGMALKLFVDGQASANLVATYSLDSQGPNPDFFLHPLTTVLNPPQAVALRLGSLVFKAALNLISDAPVNELTIPLTELASIDSSGAKASDLQAPEMLQFVPSDDVRTQFQAGGSDRDFRVGLQGISSGTVLYRVFAKAFGADAMVEVGQLVTESEFVASRYADRTLYFRHPADRGR